ncbi:MAG: (E)-4-hydroxy-3-methylbut-2-enyl-diphosphate synthase [Bacteroidales bacterium]|nr:(E)-4-hydroxy-3-methylbut-2-enyl-diphosphate synthase [Bacteroidales bacterium]
MRNLEVKVKDITIGGNSPIVVQTMCNTHTQDVAPSVEQCKEMIGAGAKIIRLTTQGLKEVEALKEIKRQLLEEGYTTPLVADVHFSSDVAIAAASVADKVRINPGNFAKEHEEAKRQFAKFIEVCKEHGTAVRIGLNHGSLGERIINLYGDTPLGMKEAVMEWLEMCVENNFYNVVVSLKASNTIVMATAYRLLKEAMEQRGVVFPLHLGVTEAGNGDMGRIKSAVGIGALLAEGIGDTIRVSLTENPVNEIPAAQTIADYFKKDGEFHNNIKVVTEQISSGKIPHFHFEEKSWNEFIIKASSLFGPLLLDKKIDDLSVSCQIGSDLFTDDSEQIAEFKDNLMQASRRKFTKPEYIACPGCGRTLYNLEETFNEVKKRTSHLKGMRIAVMGCIVNGPGEMADADYGYVGEGKGKVAIYRGKEPVMRSVPQEEAIDALLRIIEEDSK